MIDFNVTHRPSRPSEWAKLTTALLESDEKDESYWLEFKSSLDWSQSGDLGNLSRQILGMANRDPRAASSYMDGRGIVVVGLEPGLVHGVKSLDPADLDNKLASYLGADGPRWDAHWQKRDDLDILIIEVDAPRVGDPPYVLGKSFEHCRAGQVFVRAKGKTVPADQAQLTRLAHRVLPQVKAPVLDVDVRLQEGATASVYYWDEAEVESFFAREREALMEPLSAELERRRQAETPPTLQEEMVRFRQNGFKFDSESIITKMTLGELKDETRTPDSYVAAVEKYLIEVRKALPDALFEIAAVALPSTLIVASNLSHQNLKKLQITVHVAGEARALDFVDSEDLSLRSRLPRRPRMFGPYRLPPVGHGIGQFATSFPVSSSAPNFDRRRNIENGGSFKLDLEQITLRSGETDVVVDHETVILIPRHRTGPVIMEWKATASNIDAVAEGRFEVALSEVPMNLLKVGLRD